MTDHPDWETLVHVGCEGAGMTVQGRRRPDGAWELQLSANSMTFDANDDETWISTTRQIASLAEAFAGCCDCFGAMVPVEPVHEAFRAEMRAVIEHHAPQARDLALDVWDERFRHSRHAFVNCLPFLSPRPYDYARDDEATTSLAWISRFIQRDLSLSEAMTHPVRYLSEDTELFLGDAVSTSIREVHDECLAGIPAGVNRYRRWQLHPWATLQGHSTSVHQSLPATSRERTGASHHPKNCTGEHEACF